MDFAEDFPNISDIVVEFEFNLNAFILAVSSAIFHNFSVLLGSVAGFKVVYNIENNGLFSRSAGHGSAQLLVENVGELGCSEHINAVNIVDVNALVEHVNAELHLQGIRWCHPGTARILAAILRFQSELEMYEYWS